jgi:hypothetical protein
VTCFVSSGQRRIVARIREAGPEWHHEPESSGSRAELVERLLSNGKQAKPPAQRKSTMQRDERPANDTTTTAAPAIKKPPKLTLARLERKLG